MHDDLFNLLKKDHQEVMGLLEKIKGLSDREPQKRSELFNQVKMEIVPHMKAEEKAFYPVLLKDKKSKEDAMEGMEEHHAAEMVLNELIRMSPQEEFWPAKLSVFKEMVQHHIQEEEGTIFKHAREVIPHDQMSQIVENFEKEKEKVKGKTAAPTSG